MLTSLNNNSPVLGKPEVIKSEDQRSLTPETPKDSKEEVKAEKPNNNIIPDTIQKATKQPINSTLLNNPETNGDLAAIRPKVALLVDGLGLSRSETASAIEMHALIALGFSPYSQDVINWINKGVSAGHEVYINLPMHPAEYPANDAGSLALMNNLSVEENLLRLKLITSKSDKIKGVISGTREIFTDSKDDILSVLEFLKQKKLAYIYGGEVNNESLDDLSEALNLNYIDINITIDDELDAEAVKSNLLRLENMAKVRGFALGKFHAYPMSVKVINEWIGELNNSEVMLVPVSQLFELRKQATKEKSKNNVPESDNKISENEEVQLSAPQDINNKIYTKEEFEKYFDTSNTVTYVKEGENNVLDSPANKEKKSGKEEGK
ncbi:divergent polysaccharide deacetylase family protein [Candidatus Jidaibacter acanthamoebae]|uniref:divergent polysaccharide deacetylase family protein n=1 Tax=Candidatus Jidaibacter acanthamoebae TaxID=86105 RepID=UPI0019552AAE|nr:divergent polysaccharide deacetylase family protein [Candidatus Jidaibacter acanthamoeba]